MSATHDNLQKTQMIKLLFCTIDPVQKYIKKRREYIVDWCDGMKMLLVNNIYIAHMLGKLNEEKNTYQGIYFLTDVHILNTNV